MNETTWLPVHVNYKSLNLAAQKIALVSHYKVFKSMARIKKKLPVLKKGLAEVFVIKDKDVLGVARRLEGSSPVLIIPKQLVVYTATVDSNIKIGSKVDPSAMKIPGSASVLLASESEVYDLLIMSDL